MPTAGRDETFSRSFDAYLHLEGVKGDATDSDHVGHIMVGSFNFEAASPAQKGQGGGQSAGKVRISDFSVTKFTDSASPKLFQACCDGTHFKKAVLHVRKSGGKKSIDYLQYKFTELFVTDFKWAVEHNEETPTEHLSFSFASVEITYTPQNSDGNKGGAIVAGWDFKANKSL